MRPIRRFALLLPLLAACGEGPLDPGPFSLEGTWRGTAYPFALRLELEQDGENQVRGTGQLNALQEILETRQVSTDPVVLDTVRIDTVSTDSVQFDVAGRWEYPAFSLRLVREGYADAAYAGSFGSTQADTVNGTLSGSGFTGLSIRIIRQDD